MGQRQKRTRNGSRAGGAGLVFSFGQMACAPRGPEAELVFSLSWFSRRWRGAGFILSVKWLCAPRGPERRAGFFFKLVLALVARGWFSFGQVACAPRGPEVGRGVSIPPSLPLDSTLPATS